MRKLLTTCQAGKLLGVNDSRIRQFILQGRLPAIKFGAVWMIRERDLEKVKNRKPGRPKGKTKNIKERGRHGSKS